MPARRSTPAAEAMEVHFSSSPRPFLAATDSAAPTAASVKDACKRTLEDSASAAAADRIVSRIYSDQLSAREELSRAKGAEAVILELARTPNIQ